VIDRKVHFGIISVHFDVIAIFCSAWVIILCY